MAEKLELAANDGQLQTQNQNETDGAETGESIQTQPTRGTRKRKYTKRAGPVILGVILVLAIVTIALYEAPNSPIASYVDAFLSWLEALPWAWKASLFTIAQAVAVILVFPGTPFNLAAGSIFGFIWGSIISCVAIDLSSVFSFIVGRYLAREWAQTKIDTSVKWKAIDAAVETSGWYIIFLVRLAPVFPYGACSYLFGLTSCSFWKYFTSTTAGLLPGTIAYAYLGSLASDVHSALTGDDNGEHATAKRVHSIVSAVAAGVTTLATIVVITWVTRRALKKALNNLAYQQAVDEGKMEIRIEGQDHEEEHEESKEEATQTPVNPENTQDRPTSPKTY
eukprot:TRINITY_DN46232_c0_g1_i1.p1 TRINITY_DN46232_c0_g1~~TRINITY_DN46232_c0_g1_i1.p1  ORF type:complete len:337 (-),score=13.95 TRINITY_DN46232_c0_g1_i1:82-1092(-)